MNFFKGFANAIIPSLLLWALIILLLTGCAGGRFYGGVSQTTGYKQDYLGDGVGHAGYEAHFKKSDGARLSVFIEHESGIYNTTDENGNNEVGVRFSVEY